jgi:hypothetical protein
MEMVPTWYRRGQRQVGGRSWRRKAGRCGGDSVLCDGNEEGDEANGPWVGHLGQLGQTRKVGRARGKGGKMARIGVWPNWARALADLVGPVRPMGWLGLLRWRKQKREGVGCWKILGQNQEVDKKNDLEFLTA